MIVWITKYALTAGIEEANGEQLSPRAVKYGRNYAHGEGKDWHRTREFAITRAEEMRVAKIASLRKSIAKLEKLKFE